MGSRRKTEAGEAQRWSDYCRDVHAYVKGFIDHQLLAAGLAPEEERMVSALRDMRNHLRAMELAGTEAEMVREPDWLAFAIGRLGGPKRAAQRLGVSSQTIYNWLANGLGTVEFQKMARLAHEARTPLEFLALRMGPYERAAVKSQEAS